MAFIRMISGRTIEVRGDMEQVVDQMDEADGKLVRLRLQDGRVKPASIYVRIAAIESIVDSEPLPMDVRPAAFDEA